MQGCCVTVSFSHLSPTCAQMKLTTGFPLSTTHEPTTTTENNETTETDNNEPTETDNNEFTKTDNN